MPDQRQTINSEDKSSESLSNTEDLQTAVSKSLATAKTMMANASGDQKIQLLIKEVLDKLALAQQNMIQAGKLKLKSKEKEEQRSSKNDNGEKPNSSNRIGLRPKIQRTYKLTKKANFEVWLDCLKTELTSWQLLDLIDSKAPAAAGLSETEICLRKNSVKDIIISYIDEDYHTKILGMTEPKEILQKLRESRKGEISSTPTSIRTKLYNLRMNKGKKAHTFCERFDQIVREHELSDDPQKLTEQEKRSTFYQAIIGEMPEIRRTDSAVITTSGKEMDMELLRKAMYRIQEDNEADNGNSEVKNPTASRAQLQKFRRNDNKCHKCNKPGHWINECRLPPHLWFCYFCNRITDHKGDDCFNSGQSPQIHSNKRNLEKSSESYEPQVKRKKFSEERGRGRSSFSTRGRQNRGRGGGRGNFRGNFRRKSSSGESGRRPSARRAEHENKDVEYYDEDEEQYESSSRENEGKKQSINSHNKVMFIADSGATEHIVNKSFILTDFKTCKNGVI